MSHRIAILGSTGSIGAAALEVVEHLGPPWTVAAISAHRQSKKLLQQTARYRPAAVAITDPGQYASVRGQLNGDVEVYGGADGLVEMVQRQDIDMVLAAIVGSAGLPAVLAAVRCGKKLALANKEALVVAGSLLIPLAREKKVDILPVDSEHSAIFQALCCGRHQEVQNLVLTASGGPFRSATAEQIENATLADALNHPTWRMGNKISIDSATMFNKALELIEACWLFDLPAERVKIMIHPESIIHSLVEFIDGSVMAQLSEPDMRTPIQYALTYPHRAAGISRKLDWSKLHTLHLSPPDFQRFAALGVAYNVAKQGGTAGAVLNGANEAAVAAFCEGKIRFGEISRTVEFTIAQHTVQPQPSLDDLMEVDRWARRQAERVMNDFAKHRKK